jgi:anti-anti-sigma factor
MEIKRIEKQGIVVLAPQSPLIAGDAEHFGDVIHELGAVGKVRIIVDMAAVGHADALGISILVKAHSYLEQKKGHLVLLHLQKRITDVLTVIQFLTVFHTAEKLEEALVQCS